MKPKATSWLLTLLAITLPGTLLAQNEGDDAPPLTEPASDPVTVIEEKGGDVLEMQNAPTGMEPAPRRVLPHHGMKMGEVEREYGMPRDRHPAVGQPPIVRWDYDGFSVFFERSTVLHSVQADRPAEIVNKDQLLPP